MNDLYEMVLEVECLEHECQIRLYVSTFGCLFVYTY